MAGTVDPKFNLYVLARVKGRGMPLPPPLLKRAYSSSRETLRRPMESKSPRDLSSPFLPVKTQISHVRSFVRTFVLRYTDSSALSTSSSLPLQECMGETGTEGEGRREHETLNCSTRNLTRSIIADDYDYTVIAVDITRAVSSNDRDLYAVSRKRVVQSIRRAESAKF